jgi:tetraacyldisaccharide 4'-kinase
VELRNLWNGRTLPVEWLERRPVYGFCGIGNPEAFRRTLSGLEAQVTRFRAYPDHHAYMPRDLRQIDAEGQEFLAEALVTTEKDAVKLDSEAFSVTPLALKVELELVEGREPLLAALRGLLPQTTEIRQA